MKKVNKYISTVLATVLSLASCQIEPMDEMASDIGLHKVTLNANVGEHTKVYLDGININWSEDDAILVCDEITPQLAINTAKFTASSVNGNTALFSGSLHVEQPVWAFYPAYDKAFFFMGENGFRMEAARDTVQVLGEDGLDRNQFWMLGRINDDDLKFDALVSVFKFKVDRDDVTAIRFTFEGLDCGAPWNIHFNNYSEPVVELNRQYGEPWHKIMTYPESGCFEAGKEYYVTTPPGEFTTVKAELFLADQRHGCKYSLNGHEAEMNGLMNLGTLKDEDITWTDLSLDDFAWNPDLDYLDGSGIIAGFVSDYMLPITYLCSNGDNNIPEIGAKILSGDNVVKFVERYGMTYLATVGIGESDVELYVKSDPSIRKRLHFIINHIYLKEFETEGENPSYLRNANILMFNADKTKEEAYVCTIDPELFCPIYKDLIYELDDDYYMGYGDITIPAQISDFSGNTFNVTRILNQAFYESKYIETVTINTPNIIIGQYAFALSQALRKVTLPEECTIGSLAFYLTNSLKELNIEHGTRIMTGALYGSSQLEITFNGPSDYGYEFKDGMLIDASDPDYKSLLWLEHSYYADKDVFAIPEYVRTISDLAIFGLNATTLIIPASVDLIGEYNFSITNFLKTIEVYWKGDDVKDKVSNTNEGFLSYYADTMKAAVEKDGRRITLIVPKGEKDTYANDSLWGSSAFDFKIVERGTEGNIDPLDPIDDYEW